MLPLNVESDVPGGLKTMLSALRDVLVGCEGIDLTNLNNALAEMEA